MLIDRLDRDTPWIAQAGPALAISPVAPASSSIAPIPGGSPAWLLATAGTMDPEKKLYPGVLFAPGANGKASPRPILPNTGKVSFRYDLWVDESTLTAANVIETDLILVTGGYKYNLSGQRHVATGQIDIGNWTDTGIRAGEFEADKKYRIRWNYFFDVVEKTCSVNNYGCVGVSYPVPLKDQNMPATVCNWTEGAYLQIQLGSLPTGLPWSIRIGGPRLEWN